MLWSLERGATSGVIQLLNNQKRKVRRFFASFVAVMMVISPLSVMSVPVAHANGDELSGFAVYGAGDTNNNQKTQIGKNVVISGGMVGGNRTVQLAAGASAPGVRAGNDAILGGKVTIDDQENEGEEDDSTPLTTNVIANADVDVKSKAVVVGNIDGRKVKLGDTAKVQGNLVAGTEIEMVSDSRVEGNVDAQSTDLRKGIVITGTLTLPDSVLPQGTGVGAATDPAVFTLVNGVPKTPQPFTKLTMPTPSVYSASSSATDDLEVENGETANWVPGVYRDIDFSGDSTINMTSGHYVFDDLKGAAGVTLNLDLSGGPIILFATGDIHFGKNTIMSLIGGDATKVYIETAGRFKTSSGSTIYGTIYSSKSSSPSQDGISIGSKNTVFGALYSAQQVGVASGTTITKVGPYWGEPIPTTGSLKVNKVAIGGNGTFSFTGTEGIGSFDITTSSGSGSRTFDDLTPGEYSVTEGVLGEGWAETENNCVDKVVIAGATTECTITNTYTEPSVDPEGQNQLNIGGTKFNNRNEDRDRDDDEEGLEGWEMRLYVEGNEGWELIDSDVTDAQGKFKFATQQEAGTYHVCEVAKMGWHQVRQDWSGTQYHTITDNESPNADIEGPYCATVVYTDEADRSSSRSIGNAMNDPNDQNQLSLGGYKFHNKNSDRDRDEGEGVLEGWEMRLYVEGNEGWELLATDTTDEMGVYGFSQQKAAGVYHVCEVMQEGWEQVRQDWSGTSFHIVTDNMSPSASEEGPYCSTVVYTDEEDKSNKKYFGNRQLEDDEPTVGVVKLCKVDDEQTPLSGWTLMLQGTDVEQLSVPSENSTGVTSSTLTGGLSYIFKVVGTWLNDRSGEPNYVDAEYSTIDDWETQMNGFTGYGEDILDLQVNQSFVDWGTYSTAHTYARGYQPLANESVNFRIFDGEVGGEPIDGWYNDNKGSLTLTISNGYLGVTEEDGCVTFSDVPFGSYTVGELVKNGWENVSGLGSLTVDTTYHEHTVVNKQTDTNGGGNGDGDDDETPHIIAYKWHDVDYDGEQGKEDVVAEWTIALARVVADEEQNDEESEFQTAVIEGKAVEIVALGVTGNDGSVHFEVPVAGDYVVLEAHRDGWVNTAPEEREVPIVVDCAVTLSETDLATCEATEWHVDSFFDVTVGESVTEDITVDNTETPMWFGNYRLLVISNETATDVEQTSAVITWSTDLPGTSRVVYDTVSHAVLGDAPNYGYANSTVEDLTKVTEHSVTLTGLTAGQTYYYRVISSASPEVVSDEHSFSTTSSEGGNTGGGSNGGGGGGGGGVVLLSTPTTPSGNTGGNTDGGTPPTPPTPPGRVAGETDDAGNGTGGSGAVGTGGSTSSGGIGGNAVSGAVLGDSTDAPAEQTTETTDESTEEVDTAPLIPDSVDGGEGCWKIVGICWYWWLLLLLVLLLLYYLWIMYKEKQS